MRMAILSRRTYGSTQLIDAYLSNPVHSSIQYLAIVLLEFIILIKKLKKIKLIPFNLFISLFLFIYSLFYLFHYSYWYVNLCRNVVVAMSKGTKAFWETNYILWQLSFYWLFVGTYCPLLAGPSLFYCCN